MTSEGVGTKRDEVVWHMWGGDGEVGVWVIVPEFAKIDPVTTDGRVRWSMRDVEAGGADHCGIVS
jgi:hypothetical protein